MNYEKTQIIFDLLDRASISYHHLTHQETRTCQDSQEARASLGLGNVVGAKSILIKMKYKSVNEHNVFVLPGNQKINSKTLKKYFDGLKSLRFVTPEEMADLTGGLVPGSMPPFAQQIFPRLDYLYVDNSLLEQNLIGFNVASLTQSVVLSTQDYIKVANIAAVFSFT